MISWLLVIIFAYFLLAIVTLLDKYIVVTPAINPKVFSFYVGILGILVWFLVPFGFLKIPELPIILLAVSAGVIRIAAMFYYFTALKECEASRVTSIMGGVIPLFTFLFSYILSAGEKFLGSKELIAFLLLLSGGFLVSFEKEKSLTLKNLKFSGLSGFLFSLSFVFSKISYSKQSFWSGYIWMSLGFVLAAVILFLLFKEVREEIFSKKDFLQKKIFPLFVLDQGMGAVFFILQNWAIALAPLAYLSIISALGGIQYVFLLILVVLISLKFPRILKEEISSKVLLQKIVSVCLIIIGIAILAF
jgi:drug/metabolite transporter (DMT)-like permease